MVSRSRSRQTARVTRRRAAGITLVEACVVMGVIAVVAAAALPSYRALIERQNLRGQAEELRADVQLARSLALSRNETVRLTVQAGAGATCYVIHSGDASACDCVRGPIATCTSPAELFKTVHLAAGEATAVHLAADSLAFDPTRGTVTPTGTLRLLDRHGHAIHHVVSVLGRVRSCSPAGAVGGFDVCPP